MHIITILLVSLLLSACGSTENGRYQDNAHLERPPELPINKQAAEQIAANEIAPPKRRHGKGLRADVYMPEGSTTELKIKRSFDEAWSLLHQAIQHNELKVTDQDRSKGNFYVSYNGGSLFSSAASLFNDAQDKSTYLLKVEPEGEETKVTASLASKDEQSDSGSLKDGIAEYSVNKSSQLLELLYDTLHDSVKND
jgi:uncharacterized lipoprotein